MSKAFLCQILIEIVKMIVILSIVLKFCRYWLLFDDDNEKKKDSLKSKFQLISQRKRNFHSSIMIRTKYKAI